MHPNLLAQRALDAKGDGLLEMPTGTGKTVTVLSLVTSYQLAHPECGKLVYCTRTVPEMTKAIDELKGVIAYRKKELLKDAAAQAAAAGLPAPESVQGGDILAVCLSSRRNMCIHEGVMEQGDRENVDAGCRNMTASWVRARAETDPSVRLCEYFEDYDAAGSDADLTGIYNAEDLKQLGREKGWCPYFMARHVLSFANVVVYNYQYMLSPKIAHLVSRELEDKSIVVFDEAHNIDNICIETMSVTLDRRLLEASSRNLNSLAGEIKRMKAADARRLQEEYQRLLSGLTEGGAAALAHPSRPGQPAVSGGGAGAAAPPDAPGAVRDRGTAMVAGGEEVLGAPALPEDILKEAIPGNIRNAEHFIQFMKYVVRWLINRIKVAAVETETPGSFTGAMASALSVDTRPLRFAYSRLNSLMRTLEITSMDEYAPLTLVADFCTLITTYPVGYMVVLEPYNSLTPDIVDPIMQLACLDASLAIKPVFQKFQSVILMSGTLSPLDMYPKMLNFHPVVRASFEMSITRPCIAPMMVTKGADQTPLSTRFESRDDPNVTRNYAELVITMAQTVPDGLVVFFPSYSYMERTILQWHRDGMLTKIRQHKLLFLETKDVVETTLALNQFKRACDSGRGAVFFSIARGKVAEGIDFDKHYGRCVVLIGIPFQYTLSHVLRARLVYLRDTFHIREQDFLTFDALRQSSQCVGRVIRSKSDYGVMIFADARYARHDKRSKLPPWIMQFMPEAHMALSTRTAAQLARRFFKELAQPSSAMAALGTSLLSTEHVQDLLHSSAAEPREDVGRIVPTPGTAAVMTSGGGFVDQSKVGVYGAEDAGPLPTDSRQQEPSGGQAKQQSLGSMGGTRRSREDMEGSVPDLQAAGSGAPGVGVSHLQAASLGFVGDTDVGMDEALAAFVDEDDLW